MISKVLERKQQGLKIAEIYDEVDTQNSENFVWFVSSSDLPTLNHLLRMHHN